MATAEELTRLRRLAGKQLPAGDAAAVDYTDEQLLAVLASQPLCTTHAPHADLFRAAALLWEDKALQRDLEQTEVGGGGPLVTSVGQAGASVSYAHPTKLGTTVTEPNDPTAMRVLARRLRRRSCSGSGFRSADVTPSQVVLPGDGTVPEWDGGDSLYQPGRPVILDRATNPDRAVNLPELDT